ncbi:uncharacterized protein [Aristolochia californica]|uniref:uncharacterized protein n=1 Tax=Aristolochia californica TaxID=171875 RepID=UPI0035DC8BB4
MQGKQTGNREEEKSCNPKPNPKQEEEEAEEVVEGKQRTAVKESDRQPPAERARGSSGKRDKWPSERAKHRHKRHEKRGCMMAEGESSVLSRSDPGRPRIRPPPSSPPQPPAAAPAPQPSDPSPAAPSPAEAAAPCSQCTTTKTSTPKTPLRCRLKAARSPRISATAFLQSPDPARPSPQASPAAKVRDQDSRVASKAPGPPTGCLFSRARNRSLTDSTHPDETRVSSVPGVFKWAQPY